jgi:hypothetical protein
VIHGAQPIAGRHGPALGVGDRQMHVVDVEVQQIEPVGRLPHRLDLQDRMGQWIGRRRVEPQGFWGTGYEAGAGFRAPLANRVTSCLRSTSASVSQTTTRSVPPYS